MKQTSAEWMAAYLQTVFFCTREQQWDFLTIRKHY